jgi:hypothetical protein
LDALAIEAVLEEPDSMDEEEAEFFGSWSFTLSLDDGDVLMFSVGQNFGDLDVTLRRERSKEIRLATDDLQSIKIERLHGVEALVAAFGTKPNLQEARLTLHLTFRLDWGLAVEA